MAGYLEIVWSGVTYDLTNQDNVNTYLTKLSYIQSSFNPTAITTGNITASGTLAVTGTSTLTGLTTVGALNFTGIVKDTATPQTLTGVGLVSLTTNTTLLVTTANNDAVSLANGAEGQYKEVIMKTNGGNGILIPATRNGYATITFTAVGQSCTLKFQDGKWNIISVFGATVA
jgi:hypothetical protein